VPACTPLLLVISAMIVPISSASQLGTAHPDVRSAVLWLLIEAVIVWRVLAAGRAEKTVPAGSAAVAVPAAA
jgi:hypothetical protein